MDNTVDLKDFKVGNVYWYENGGSIYIGLLMEINHTFLYLRTIHDTFGFMSDEAGLTPLAFNHFKECKNYSEKEKLALILKYS
jgi:hypothetical protein